MLAVGAGTAGFAAYDLLRSLKPMGRTIPVTGPQTPEQRKQKRTQSRSEFLKKLKASKRKMAMDGLGSTRMTRVLGLVPREMPMGTFHVYKSGPGSSLPNGPQMSTWWRWQTNYGNQNRGSIHLGAFDPVSTNLGTSAAPYTSLFMNVVAFNISSMPYGNYRNDNTLASPVFRHFAPAYRLRKQNFLATWANQNYTWQPLSGEKNDPSGLAAMPWQFVKKSDKTRSYANPQFHHFQHNYTSGKLTFYGSTIRPTRVVVEAVRFKKEFGPQRAVCANFTATSAVSTFDLPATSGMKKDYEGVDSYWDAYCAERLYNPMKAPTKFGNVKPYITISKKEINLCQNNTNDVNQTPCACVLDFMHHDGGVYFSGWDTEVQVRNGIRYVGTTPNEPGPNFSAENYGYANEGLGEITVNSGMFGDYEDDVYLMITGIGEDMTGPTVGADPPYTFPSLDIRLEGKWTTLGASEANPALFFDDPERDAYVNLQSELEVLIPTTGQRIDP